MLAEETQKTRRLNLLMSEALIERLEASAKGRGMSMSAFVREAVEKECERAREEALEEAADSLAEVYASEPDLTAFTALDGEDFA